MTDKAVITGSFADFRNVKSRSIMQIIIEVPIEAAQDALSKIGYPVPGVEIPVAVARLNEVPEEKPKPKNYTGAAKMLSQDTGFWEYSSSKSSQGAESYIEERCCVLSCAEIKDGTEAGKKFARLFAEYQEWASNYGNRN